MHPKYQNINSSCSLCSYTQNIEVPHCADAPDRAAHQRLLRLGPRCLGQRRRLWSHKVFLFNHFVFPFACLDLFRSSSGFVMKFASTILHWNIRELKIDEVKSLDPVNLRKINMSDFLEAMKRIKKWADLVLQKKWQRSPLRSVSPDSLVPYEAWNQKFGEGAA